MHKSILVLALSSACLSLAACGRAAPDAGQEAVLIQKPLFFGHGGVEPDPIKAGLTYTAFTTDSVYVNVQPQTIKEHFEDLMSKDGVPISFDAYLKLQVIDSVSLVQNFGGAYSSVPDPHSDVDGTQLPYWYFANLQGPDRNIIRDEVKQYGLNEVAITYSAAGKIEGRAKESIEAYLVSHHLPLQLIDFSMGKANPPDSVRDQRIKTAAEQQRRITEQQTQLAEETRKGAEIARADADNSYRNAMGLNPEQFIELQQINMMKDVCGTHRIGKDLIANCNFVSPGTSAIVSLSH